MRPSVRALREELSTLYTPIRALLDQVESLPEGQRQAQFDRLKPKYKVHRSSYLELKKVFDDQSKEIIDLLGV